MQHSFTRKHSFSGFAFNNLGIITDGAFTNEATLPYNFTVKTGDYFYNRMGQQCGYCAVMNLIDKSGSAVLL